MLYALVNRLAIGLQDRRSFSASGWSLFSRLRGGKARFFVVQMRVSPSRVWEFENAYDACVMFARSVDKTSISGW